MKIIIFPLAAFLLLAVTGCSRSERQARADATAGIQAAMPHADGVGQAILAGAAKQLAGVGSLPPPRMTPEQIEEDPKAYSDLEPATSWLGPAILSGTVAVLGLLRTSPGAFGIAADLLSRLLAPLAVRRRREMEKRGLVVAQSAMQYGQAITEIAARVAPELVAEVKEKAAAAQERLGIREDIDHVLAAMKPKKVQP